MKSHKVDRRKLQGALLEAKKKSHIPGNRAEGKRLLKEAEANIKERRTEANKSIADGCKMAAGDLGDMARGKVYFTGGANELYRKNYDKIDWRGKR